MGWIQRGLRQPWPVHGSAADWISAWSLAHSTARNSSSHGSCRWAMLSSGEGCNFLEGSEAGQNGAVENQPSLRQAAPRGSGRVSAGPRAGQSHCQRCPCHSGLGVRCCRLHTVLLNVSLTSLAVTYPHCLVIADEKAVPSLAWFVSHFFYLCVPAPPTHPQCLGNGCRSGVPGSRSSLQRQGSGSTGGADPACPFRGWHQYCPVEKGDLYLRGCAPSPRWPGQHHAWLSQGADAAALPGSFPTPWERTDTFSLLYHGVSEEEYLLVWCMQVLSISMQTCHFQGLVIGISRWTLFSVLLQDFSTWWLMSNVFW